MHFNFTLVYWQLSYKLKSHQVLYGHAIRTHGNYSIKTIISEFYFKVY